MNWVDLKIGDPSEKSIGIGKTVMFFSVLMLVINPSVKVTFGQASLAGLGISVTPPVTIPVGALLLLLLTYRLVSFWVNLIIDNGTDIKKARGRVYESFTHDHERKPQDMNEVMDQEADYITFKWRFRKIVWVVFVPCFLSLAAYAKYFVLYFGVGQ